ncbi:RluA family pseudouridine synthase [Maribacter sp. 2304DJ31-5]|uniref:RluA family pseudouridine synthase n=1 Tax=Maribacter sp. 2304DJ31-5 TaxID=3386273 RepID=UPI0039BD86A7
MKPRSIETHTAIPQEKPIRLQEYGIGIFTTISTKSALKKVLKKNLIAVNGKIATSATYIHGGEYIELKEETGSTIKREFQLQLEVVYEDDHLAVINKPAGILVSGNSFRTMANALPRNLMKSDQEDAVVPRPVHRLDYPTTGLLLVGKTSTAILTLNQLFQKKQIIKAYYAVTHGKMQSQGRIIRAIDGKEAISDYEVLEILPSERFGFLNLVKLFPITGRRHQLRKHMAFIGNPILGDATYGLSNLTLKGKGLYLHAQVLEFWHPITKEKMLIETGFPKKFVKLFGTLAK